MTRQEEFELLLQHIKTSDAPIQIGAREDYFVQVPEAHAKVIYSTERRSWDDLGIYDFQQRMIPIGLFTEDGIFYYDENQIRIQSETPEAKSFSEAAQEIYQYVKDNCIAKLRPNFPEITLNNSLILHYTTCARRDIFYQKPRYKYATEAALCRNSYHPAILGKERTIEEVFNQSVSLWGIERVAEDVKRKEFYNELYEHPELCLKPWELELYDAVRQLKEQGASSFSVHLYRSLEDIDDDRVSRQSVSIDDFINAFSSKAYAPELIAYLSYKGTVIYDARPDREERLQELEDSRQLQRHTPPITM